MKTRDTQGSFITVIWTLIAMVRECTSRTGAPNHPRAEMVADLLLLPVVSRTMQRRLAEEARLTHLVFRYSSSPPCASSCASSSSSFPSSSPSLLRCWRNAHSGTQAASEVAANGTGDGELNHRPQPTTGESL